jgi:hypothetical protein
MKLVGSGMSGEDFSSGIGEGSSGVLEGSGSDTNGSMGSGESDRKGGGDIGALSQGVAAGPRAASSRAMRASPALPRAPEMLRRASASSYTLGGMVTP